MHNDIDKNQGSQNLNAIRLQRILSTAGENSTDPVGLLKHFKVWHEFATTPNPSKTFPIIFLNLNRLTSNSGDLEVLKKFVNVTKWKETDFEYKASKRKGVDLIDASLNTTSSKLRSQILKGIEFYNSHTQRIDEVHGKVFQV